MQVSKRYVFIGDIHGCYAELSELLAKVGVNPGDLVISVGDIVNGHSTTASGKPRMEGKTVGLDTGCVYGGRLTAAGWERGGWFIVSVPARHAYTRPGVLAGVRSWLSKKRGV